MQLTLFPHYRLRPCSDKDFQYLGRLHQSELIYLILIGIYTALNNQIHQSRFGLGFPSKSHPNSDMSGEGTLKDWLEECSQAADSPVEPGTLRSLDRADSEFEAQVAIALRDTGVDVILQYPTVVGKEMTDDGCGPTHYCVSGNCMIMEPA